LCVYIATKTENQAGEVKKAPGENDVVFLPFILYFYREIFWYNSDRLCCI